MVKAVKIVQKNATSASRLDSSSSIARKPASTEALREHAADHRTSEDDEAALPDPTNTQRTVRRKKSSLGLRDVFLAGGAGPN